MATSAQARARIHPPQEAAAVNHDCTRCSQPARRRALASLLAVAGIAIVGAAPVFAQGAYPTKPIMLVVPYPPGGANDMLGRLIGKQMGDALGQPMVVENKPGAGTIIGTTAVAKAAPDGYTLLIGGLASFATSPHLMKADYDPLKDFTAIGMFGTAPTIVITYADSPFKTINDAVAAAKAKPGEVMYGSSGNGSALHLAGELFAIESKTQMTHVPYKGGSAHTLDLMAGRLQLIFDSTTNAMPLIKSGKVRALAVASPKRLPDLPDVPTFAEAGYPNFEVTSWYGLFGPAKMPPAIVAKLSSDLQKVLKQPEVIEKLRGVGITPATGEPAPLAALIPTEYEKYGKLIKTANIKPD
jgi:tripartite-type tricarboxylate transporter receptor subunit TctC